MNETFLMLYSVLSGIQSSAAPDATSEKHLILHSVLNGMDFLLAIILLLAVLNGLSTGLIMKLGQIVAVIISYVAAALLASEMGIAQSVVFVPAFAVLSIVSHCLVQSLRLVDKIPVVGTMDKFGGAVLNFVVAFTVIYFVVNLLFNGIIPQSTLDSMGWTKEALNKTMFISSLLNQ